jgi:hypothetical protein
VPKETLSIMDMNNKRRHGNLDINDGDENKPKVRLWTITPPCSVNGDIRTSNDVTDNHHQCLWETAKRERPVEEPSVSLTSPDFF